MDIGNEVDYGEKKNLGSISLNFYKLYVAMMKSRRGVAAQCHSAESGQH